MAYAKLPEGDLLIGSGLECLLPGHCIDLALDDPRVRNLESVPVLVAHPSDKGTERPVVGWPQMKYLVHR